MNDDMSNMDSVRSSNLIRNNSIFAFNSLQRIDSVGSTSGGMMGHVMPII